MAAKAEFVIREVRKSDGPDIIRNYYGRYDELKTNPSLGVGVIYPKPSVSSERKWFSNLLKQVKSGKAIAYVALVKDRVVGVCDAVTKESIVEKSHVGTVGIHIIKGYRSMGIGTALLNAVISKSKGRYKLLVLDVFDKNTHARRLYAKFGFKKYGMLPNGMIRGAKGLDDVQMYRKV